MPILFLDFDGVLHPEHCHESKHFCCLSVLEEAVRQVPECDLVIASTWRLQYSLEHLRQRFSAHVAARILGTTPRFIELIDVPDTLVAYEREAECRAWLWAHQATHRPWLAVDDRSWLYRPFCKSLLLVDGKAGLTRATGEQLAVRLRQLL